jgi:hypothetical protein
MGLMTIQWGGEVLWVMDLVVGVPVQMLGVGWCCWCSSGIFSFPNPFLTPYSSPPSF